MEKLTWKKLVELQPPLEGLLNAAKAIKDDKSKSYFCANEIWYEMGFKEVLRNLVGNEITTRIYGMEIIYTSEAYDLAYDKIYNTLPNCRNCICI